MIPLPGSNDNFHVQPRRDPTIFHIFMNVYLTVDVQKKKKRREYKYNHILNLA